MSGDSGGEEPPDKTDIGVENENIPTFDQQQNERNSQQKEKPKYLYTNTDTGPFYVYIENNNPNFNGKINAIKVGEIIYNCHKEIDNRIKQIDSVGKNRIRINFKDYQSANILVQSTKIKPHLLEAYIPGFLLHRTGVIKGIDADITEKFLEEKIKPFDLHSKFSVAYVKRINRKKIEGGIKEFIPTRSIIVSFKSQQLPKYIAINHVLHNVEPYVKRVVMCYNCFRYGHLASQCKSNSRCQKCHEKHDSNQCQSKNYEVKCFSCGGEHLTSQFKQCQEFKRQKDIKKYMSESNLTYKDASLKLPKVTYASVTTSSIESIRQNNSLISTNNNKQYQCPTYARNNIQTSNKRPRVISPDPIEGLHKQLLAPINPPRLVGGVPESNIYKNNIHTEGTSKDNILDNYNGDLVKFQEQILDLVKYVINSMKRNNSFDIPESAILNVITSKLGQYNNSSNLINYPDNESDTY